MTPKEKVLSKHSKAMVWPCWWDREMLMVFIPPINVELGIDLGDKLSGPFPTADEAWQDAADHMETR